MHTEDHRFRKATSSSVAGMLGLSPFETPVEAWEVATGRKVRPQNKAMDRGNRLESAVLQYAADVLGLKYRKAQTVVGDWHADSPDALFERDGNVVALGEAKTVNSRQWDQWGEPETDQIPEHVAIQCYWHLWHHPEINICYVPILGGYSMEFQWYQLRRDDETIDAIVTAAHDFWERYIKRDTPPPARPADAAAIDRLNLGKSSGVIATDPQIILSVDAQLSILAMAKAEADEATARVDEAKLQLRKLLETYDGCKGDGWSVSYRQAKGKARTDWEALAKKLGATEEQIAAATTFGGSYRMLRINDRRSGGT